MGEIPRPACQGPALMTQARPDADSTIMQFFELQIDFFLPVWRRVALVAVCLGWAAFEFLAGAPFWGVIFGVLGIYAVWQLFFDGWPDDSDSAGS